MIWVGQKWRIRYQHMQHKINMGVAIQCILEHDVLDIPPMEGKSLAMAYCNDLGGEPIDDSSAPADIISIDFEGGKTETSPSSAPTSGESLLGPLGPFVAGGGDGTKVCWHDASTGLAAVRGILGKLRDGATVTVVPEFEFGFEGSDELTAGVQYDLEQLGQILTAAEKAHIRFRLAFDV